jgi:antitoxin (DNA-binding transcriptional repressor) of toxin-antitoxin stability system
VTAVTIEQAQAKLPELIHSLTPGEEMVITENNLPVAKLIPESLPTRKPRRPGNCSGMLAIISDDDEHLEDFAEYMP